ncbi:MAG: Fe-S cluster assembly protein SufD [Chloroflexi bacterium]|nr:Fe-S cluster assembly protein SufD [Chloroflexota bacterium]
MDLELFLKSVAAKDPEWIQSLRSAAASRFVELGFPAAKNEEWKYTNVASIAHGDFALMLDDLPREISARLIQPFTFEEPRWSRLVFINGVSYPALSSVPNLPEGVQVGSLADVMTKDGGALEQHLAQHARYQDNTFTALNTASFRDGAFIYVPDGIALKEPVHLLFVSVAGEKAIVSHPRSLIISGRGSALTIIESYVSLADGQSFTNAVTEIVAGEGAIIDYYKFNRDGERAFHVGTTQVHQYKDSRFTSLTVAVGGKLVRNNLNILPDATGCECALNGLYFAAGEQHIDNHVAIDHVKPQGTSRLLYKGVLGGKSRAVFNGRVTVHKDAQKTDAHQTNKNLLLSDYAEVDSKPQLEILADDVRCTHGAAVGQLDRDAVFYLLSRGLDRKTTRNLLTYAFASEVVNSTKVERVRSEVDKIVATWIKEYLETEEPL